MKIEPTGVYSYEEVQKILGVKKTTMSKLLKVKTIRYAQIGKVYRFLGEYLIEDIKAISGRL